MTVNSGSRHSTSGPFGMGWQGYVIAAIIVVVSAVFAATRRDWTSLIVSALALPLLMFAAVYGLSRLGQSPRQAPEGTGGTGDNADLLTFLARTNPFMFLLLAALTRRSDEGRYQDLLRSGPYGLGRTGYLVALALLLVPLIGALLFISITGQQPTHIGPHFL